MSEASWQAVVIGLSLVVGIQAILLVALMRQVGRVLLRIGPARVGELDEGPAVGEVLAQPAGMAAGASLFLFVSPGCKPCEALVPSLGAFARAYEDVALTAVVTGDGERAAEVARRIGAAARPDLRELFSAWRIPGTPFAVALADGGRVRATGVVNTLEQLEVMAAVVLEPPNLHEPHTPDSNGRTHVDAIVRT